MNNSKNIEKFKNLLLEVPGINDARQFEIDTSIPLLYKSNISWINSRALELNTEVLWSGPRVEAPGTATLPRLRSPVLAIKTCL